MLADARFNRTLMELKHYSQTCSCLQMLCFNRTLMELKQVIGYQAAIHVRF